LAAGFGPRFPGLGSRPVRVARRSRKAGDPSGRPIVSAPRSADIVSLAAGWSIKSMNRLLHLSSSGATLTSPSSRRSRCARTLDQRQSCARETSRARRIQRHISRRRHEMVLVQNDGTVARLEQVARHPQARVDDRAIAPMRLAERPPEPLAGGGDEDQVDMVGHQAMAPDLDPVLARLLGEQVTVEFMVGVREEHGLAPIAALGDMMRQAGDDETRDASRGRPRKPGMPNRLIGAAVMT